MTWSTNDLVALVGVPIMDVEPPHVACVSEDAIRQFARACGDDNPLYSDPEYARRSVRGVLVAPPLFALATGTPAAPPEGSHREPLDLGGLQGGGLVITHERWRLLAPIVEGVRLERATVLAAAGPASSPWDDAPGDGAFEMTTRCRYWEGGTTYAVRERTRRYGGHAPASDATPARSRTTYSSETMQEIEAAYAAERPRGRRTRSTADVAAGDQVGPLVKGPLTATDLVTYRAGVGRGPLGGEPLRLSYLNRKRRPQVYRADEHGVWDIVERLHWDESFAQRLGHPTAYDYSHTRLTWFSHLVTDWMGDGGWLFELAGTTALGLNYVGDVHVMEGTVRTVVDRGPLGEVQLDLRGRNQLGEVTCTAEALVLLPGDPGSCVTGELVEGYGSPVR